MDDWKAKAVDKYKYCSVEDLVLREDVAGARMWSVALENTMLTYFEVDPNSTFEPHSHHNEQITFVLQGELFFEIMETVVQVKAGEVIAIHSNVVHSVYTKGKMAKAIDAWSPPVGRYRS